MTDSQSAATRVLVIGLDGATWTNLLPLAEQGVMPTLGRLLLEGAWGVLNSTVPALTPPAWASLVTGTNPGQHGIYHFRHTPAGDYYQRRLNTSRDIQRPAIWQRLNQHGRRVGVMNVPLCHPVYPVDGFLTSDAFAPDPSQVSVYPPELAPAFAQYKVDVTNYPTALPNTDQYAPQMLAFVEENERVLLSQADTAVNLLQSQRLDFLMVGWMVTDRLGHFAWKYSDPACAVQWRTDDEQRIGARVRAVFAQLDRQIGRLIEAAGPATTVVLASDHGFGPVPGAFFNTNRWLAQRGYLKLLPAWHPKHLLAGNLPRSWKARLHVPIDSKHGLVDWRQTTVWADPLESRAVGIHFNRVSRYRTGTVDDHAYAALRARVLAELRDLQAPGGGRLFAALHPAEELYHGAHAAEGPDVVAILAKAYDVPPSFRRDVRARELITPNRHILRDGGHEPEGIYLLWGANVRAAGRLDAQPIESIAPTILQCYGLPLDDDFDAGPITGALRDEFLRAHPPRRNSEPPPATPPAAAGPAEYSDEDSAAVEERLRNLGYLD